VKEKNPQMKNLTVSKSRHQPLHREGATVHEARSEALSPHEVAAEKSQRTSTRRKERKTERKENERNLRTRASDVSPAIAMPTCSSILNTFF